MDKKKIIELKKKFEDLLSKEPNNKDALFSLAALHYNLGNSSLRKKKIDIAIKHYLQSIKVDKKFVSSYYNLGNAYKEKEDLEKAIKYFKTAVDIDPNKIPAKINLGVANSAIGNSKDCIKHFMDLLTQNNYKSSLNKIMESDIRYSLGIELLREGKYEEGLQNYEHRLQASDYSLDLNQYKNKPSNLNEIKNKKVLVLAEQGIGDVFQFIRYLKLLEKYASEIYFQCSKKLFRVLKCIRSIKKFYDLDEKIKDYDFCIPLLSLPLLFNSNLKTIPNFSSYICPEERLVNTWNNKLKKKEGYKIGLFWKGNTRSTGSKKRSINLKDLETLLELKKINFISLQKGEGHEEIKKTKFSKYMIDNDKIIDTGKDAFVDTAAIIKNLDLVISIDTGMVQLCGAIGTKIWMLSPKVPNWPWTNYGTTTPWYSSLKIFRQEKVNDWEKPIKNLKNKLSEILQQ